MLTDDELMAQYVLGDAGAFDVLYARHKDAVFRYFQRQLPRTVAEDCHQETWLQLVRGRSAYVAEGHFRAWLFTLAHNILVNRFRTNGRRIQITSDDVDVPVDAGHGASVERGAINDELLRRIADLPLHQRDALMLKHEGGFTLAEIAEMTGTGVEGVKSRLRYATRKLREWVELRQTS